MLLQRRLLEARTLQIGGGVNGTLVAAAQINADGQLNWTELGIATSFGIVAGPLAANSTWAGTIMIGGTTNAGQTVVTNFVNGENDSPWAAFGVGAILSPLGRFAGGIAERTVGRFASQPTARSTDISAVIGQVIDTTVSASGTVMPRPISADRP